MSKRRKTAGALSAAVAVGAVLIVVLATARQQPERAQNVSCVATRSTSGGSSLSDGFFHNFIGTPGPVADRYTKQHPFVDPHKTYPSAQPFTDLPTEIPAGGAALNDYEEIVFPFTGHLAVSAHSARQTAGFAALASAAPAREAFVRVCAERADILLTNSPPLAHGPLPAWIVTYLSSKAVDVSAVPGRRKVSRYRENVVLNARTGDVVFTFFTP